MKRHGKDAKILFVNITKQLNGFNFCIPNNNKFFSLIWWPNKDILVYLEDDVLSEIEPPVPVNQRGHYKLSEADFKRANEMIAPKI